VRAEAQKTARARAWEALSERLKEALTDQETDAFVGGTHTRRLADNLLQGFSLDQVRALRSQLEAGDGGELAPTKTGKRKAHAPYSSATFAINLFGRWLGAEQQLRVAALTGFDRPLKIEHKLKIKHGGGTANLDCFLEGPTIRVGIECKLTETLTPHSPVEWKDCYRAGAMADLLVGGWQEVFRDSLSGRWTPQHLGLEQLLKHALALNSHSDERAAHLVYCYWEPTNADDIGELRQHGSEIAELLARLDQTPPTLHVTSYKTLLEEWSRLTTPSWVAEHIGQLHDRYTLSI
jgi:hypothetical protein